MSQEFQQHWLSAYLDNELSSDERALVERRLEEDADARQLLEDLKRVRGLVATLPAWPGANFQFDMSRLSDDELADDDDLDELAPVQTHLTIGKAQPQERSPVINSAAVNEPARESAEQSAGMSAAAWRGVLSLAAGLLLLILCVPLFWQRDAGTLAVRERPGAEPQADFGATSGMMGGTGSAAVPDAAGDAPAAEAKSLADSTAPPAAAPFNAPIDPRSVGGGRGASAPPGPSRPSAGLSNAVGGPGAASGMGGVGGASAAQAARTDPQRVELSAESLNNQPPGPPRSGFAPGPMQPKRAAEPQLGLAVTDPQPSASAPDGVSLSSQSFMCAKSDAWSEAEVKQTLPQLLAYVSEHDPTVQPTDAAKAKTNVNDKDLVAAKSVDIAAEINFAKVPAVLGKNELVFSELPMSDDVNKWFTQIQTAQPLTQLQLAPELLFKNRDVQEADKLAEATQSRSVGRSVPPEAPSAAAKADASPAALKPEAAGKTLQFDSAQAKKEATSQGRIILFVTAAEAKKILSTLFPSKPGGPPDQNSDEKKVIVILNR